MASRSGSGSGFALGLERTQQHPAWTVPSPTPAASRPPPSRPPAPSTSSPLPLPLPLPPPSFRRPSRPPAPSAASFSAAVTASAQNPAPGLTAPQEQQRQQQQQQQQRYAPSSSSSFQTARLSASAASTISAASASAAAVAASSPSSPLLTPSSATARPILPPLPQISPLSRYSTPRQQRHSRFPPSTPASASAPASASLSQPGPDSITCPSIGSSAVVNPSGLSTLQPDPFSPLNSPFDRPPVFGPQTTNPWSAYASQRSQSNGWPQDDAAASTVSLSARSRALNALDRLLSEATFGSSFTSQQPSLQSPSQLLQSPFSRFPAPSPASASNSTTAFLTALSPLAAAATPAATTPSAQLQPQSSATRPSRISSTTNTTLRPTVPPVSEQAFSPLNTLSSFGFSSDNSELDGLFCDLDGFPGFSLPFTNTPGASVPSTFDNMPTTSGRLRSRVPPETHGSSTAAAPSRKRRRISPSAVPPPPSAQTTLIEDDVDDVDSLFGSSPSRPASPNSKVEEYTTIDLTEATDVPEELKKPEVDKRVKLSAFQCVICMDDVTGLTLTHCGHLFCAQCLHSSLSMEPTRGKCPMCRTKIDMKPRATYSTKTKGYWPLELKLMTRTRQGKRKAQDID
ncbi:hypothetical protein CCMA1212_005986 [Trichoderma ghanense]|uniref:RING-type domain-containing protein n=1 Tax=Trichoderma ghanense TaxID=65468 RepID=A0ABY2H383_9HYPO